MKIIVFHECWHTCLAVDAHVSNVDKSIAIWWLKLIQKQYLKRYGMKL